MRCDHGTIGIEVTELCREGPRAEAGRLGKVANKAQERFRRLASSHVVDVGATFAPRVKHIGFDQLVGNLADFVLTHQHKRGGFNWNNIELPDGYCYIGIHEPLSAEGRWWTANAFDTAEVQKQLLDSRIQAKNQRLPQYRAAVPEAVWLLIVIDRFFGAGGVDARPDHLANWKFTFEFDKVLLFLREASGIGEVIELEHT